MRYFKITEFDCKCGCGLSGIKMASELLILLDRGRNYAGVPFIVTSGMRCKAHNLAVGGKPDSAHLRGTGVDIATPNALIRHAVLMGLIHAGFTRFGIGADFVHTDLDITKNPNRIWLY